MVALFFFFLDFIFKIFFKGIDVSANQIERGDTETFQLEEDDVGEKWKIRTNTNKYWKLETGSSIQATGDGKYV
jgi:hypothetical protein